MKQAGAEVWELAAVFLRLGTTAFGGPAAHIAMMEDEIVTRRQWLSREEFIDLLGATNLIPGPNSTELAIHIGYRRAGFAGLIVAGVCFILPAALIVAAIAWAYVRYGKLPPAEGILYGVKPVIIAIVAQALWRLGPTVLTTKLLVATAVVAVALGLAGVNELVILFGSGAAVAILRTLAHFRRSNTSLLLFLLPAIGTSAASTGVTAGTVGYGLLRRVLFFLRVAGSG
jgi:chromate transporter